MKINEKSGFTSQEQKCHDYLMKSYGEFLEMERQHPDEMRDFVDCIHRMQDILAVRIVRRAYPGYWPTHKIKDK